MHHKIKINDKITLRIKIIVVHLKTILTIFKFILKKYNY